MIDLSCKKCGNPHLEKKNGLYACPYCGNIFLLDESERYAGILYNQNITATRIDIQSDVDVLLEKCRKDPKNARRYANRILDIDPTNREALKYI